MSAVHPTHHYSSFSSRSGAPFIVSCGPSSVTGRYSDEQGLGSLDDTIFGATLALQNKKLTRWRTKLLDGKFFFLP